MDRTRRAVVVTLVVSVCMGAAMVAGSAGRAVVTAREDVQWADAGIPGVRIAAVDGETAKGASHFYLSYPPGLVTPVHHHSPDHYVTTLAGDLVLVVEGKEHRLPPGSFFALTGAAKHVARCESSAACVMFIDARGPWDVVAD